MKTTKNGHTVLDDTWMIERFHLFENYCLPSVQNQSAQNFLWLVIFDSTTSEKYRKIIGKMENIYSNFIPLFADGENNLQSTIWGFINKDCEDNQIITSRMDNDDIIHTDFIHTIQSNSQNASNNELKLIDLSYGLRMNSQGKIVSLLKKIGPFISLICPLSMQKMVMDRQHGHWRDLPKSSIIRPKQKLWIQLIHDRNLKNKFPLFRRKERNVIIKDFGLSSPGFNI